MEATTSRPTENVKEEDSEVKGGEVKTASTAATAISQPVDLEDVPDPDEDDLDDLDDMLEEFSATKLDSTALHQPAQSSAPTMPESSTKAPAAPSAAPQPPLEEDFSEEEFAKQLQAGMAGLLGELEQSPEMQAQMEELFKQMSDAVGADEKTSDSTAAPRASAAKNSKPAADTGSDSFQETIRRTMERMQTSGDQATTAATAAGSGDDFMAEMLKQMTSGEFGGDGSDEDFSKMLMGMMEQLTNKEILYEPMKELHDKFPDWLAKNRGSVSAEDLKRYEEQKAVVAEIVAKFDEPTYSDSNAADREYIVDRMQKMQAAGSPPSDLVGDMASAQDAITGMDESCNPQ